MAVLSNTIQSGTDRWARPVTDEIEQVTDEIEKEHIYQDCNRMV